MPDFKTIRQTAATGLISERQLRLMVAQGKCPGKATINMEDDITVIAGANNSGKTSVVELFNYVFNAKGGLCCDDLPVYESQK